jgi:hypothetical protein
MEQPTPNWYPDPAGQHPLRWWDGTAWTDRVSDGPPLPPEPAGRRRLWRRFRGLPVWAQVLAWVGLGVVALAGIGLVGLALDETVLTHDLLHEDFSDGAGRFRVGTTSGYRFDVVDHAYAIESTTTPEYPARAFAWFARTAYNVDLSADVAAMADPSGQGGVGIGCFDDPTGNGHGYEFAVEKDTFLLLKDDDAGVDVLANVPATQGWPPAGHRLRITCSPSLSGDVTIHGYVDDAAVIDTVDLGGFGQYRSMVLLLHTDEAGVSVRFDNVTAVVPGG